MAKAPTKASSKKDSSATKVTRIKASESTEAAAAKKPASKAAKAPKKAVKVKPAIAAKATSTPEPTKRRRNPFAAIGRYFKGSWHELMQVRWPDRKSTWSMTGALIAFTIFFVIIILLADFGFSKLFNLILGSN